MADDEPNGEPSESEEYSSSEEEEDVEAAILSRGKRSTAGRRLTSLVGKAAEDDQAFWGHDTWNEDEGSENESFHESDEDPEQRVDAFDSDFDDSEDDNAEEDQADADAEDKELAKQERRKKQAGKNKIHGLAKAARDLARGTAASAGKRGFPGSGAPVGGRLMGDGDNAGIILNLPPSTHGGPSAAMQMFSAPGVVRAPAMAPTPQMVSVPRSGATQQMPTSSSRHVRRATQHSKYSSRFRAARSSTSSDTGTASANTSTDTPGATISAASPQVSKRKLTAAERAGDKPKRPNSQMAQEDLIMEAVRTTAPENNRWLLGRKRAAEDMETREQQGGIMKGFGGHQGDKKLVDRYSSKRGALNVLSFFEMDHVPEIFTQNSQRLGPPSKPVCVITGKPARYKDPASKLPYHDLQAYKLLKQRLQDGSLKPLEDDSNGMLSQSVVSNQTQMTDNGKAPVRAPSSASLAAKTDSSGQSDTAVSKETGIISTDNSVPPIPKGKATANKKGVKRSASSDGPTPKASGLKPGKKAKKQANSSNRGAAPSKSTDLQPKNNTLPASQTSGAMNGKACMSDAVNQDAREPSPKQASFLKESTTSSTAPLPSPQNDGGAMSSTPVTPPHPESKPSSDQNTASSKPVQGLKNVQKESSKAENKPLSPRRATRASSTPEKSATPK